MKKLVALLMAILMVFSLAACGGGKGGTKLDEKFVGKWIGVGGDIMDMSMNAEEAAAYTLEVKADGKVILAIDGEAMESTGTVSGDTLSFKESTLDIEHTAVLTDGVLYVENIMDFGINVYMAKEGDTSVDTTQFLPEDVQELIGTWVSYQVLDVLDEDMSDVIPADALVVEFYPDNTADVMIGDDYFPEEVWAMMDGLGWFEEDTVDMTWELIDGELVVDYYDAAGDGYYFTCEKVD